MITVNITGENTYADKHLDQYDYGQILRMYGELQSPVEVQFSLQKTGGEAPRRLGTEVDGVIEVEIPDEMLRNNDTTQNYQIYAFVYVRDETSGETTHRIVIPVKSRPKPGNYLPPEPKDYGEQLLSNIQNETRKAIEAKDESKEYAEQAKKASAEASEDAKKNIDEYVESKKEELKGEPGKPGADGYTPQKGKDYFDGANGKSAYEYARDGGYTGTEEDFYKMMSEDVPQISELKSDIADKLDKPASAPEVGKILKVLSVNDDGTFTCEWADAPSCAVDDVKINGNSIVGENGVAEIPLISTGNCGVVYAAQSNEGLVVTQRHELVILPAIKEYISNRTNYSKNPIVPTNLDYAVKCAMTDGIGEAWTSEEQAMARIRIGSVSSDDVSTMIENALSAIDVAEEGTY